MNPACVAMLLVAAAAPGAGSQPPEPQTEAEPVLEGIWPTERMIESVIRRTALETADTYDLTDEQYRQVETGMLRRWPEFLRKHRPELQPLVNEYFEARLGPEPPTTEQVQAWATRALPLAERFEEQIEIGNREIRSLLTPAQRGKFEAQAVKMRMGIRAFREQIKRWRQGRHELEELWDRPRGFERRAGREKSAIGRDRVERPDPIDTELTAWDRYVADFIAAHRLTEGQQTAATSILKELQQRARAHRDRNRIEMQELERAIETGKPEDESRIQADLARLYGPIDALFSELADRLNTLPTRAQRRTATQPAR